MFFAIGAFLTIIINHKADSAKKVANWNKILVYFFIVISIISLIYINNLLFIILAICIIFRGLYELIYTEYKNKSSNLFFTIAIIVYLFLSIFFCFFSFSNRGILIFTFLIVTVSDGFSQISGQLFGKTKLVPYISPSKTIEGFIGGIIFSIIISVLIVKLLNLSLITTIFLAIIISVLAEIGDIAASFYKRKHGIKDFPLIIPYHGGFLDRFDSFIFAGAFVGFYNFIFKI
jgi:phosphatidate cytidylyltransferase